MSKLNELYLNMRVSDEDFDGPVCAGMVRRLFGGVCRPCAGIIGSPHTSKMWLDHVTMVSQASLDEPRRRANGHGRVAIALVVLC